MAVSAQIKRGLSEVMQLRDYDLRLDGYEISRWEYKELLAFCRQYEAKKTKAADLLYKTTGNLTGMPRGSNTSDPVCASAVQRERLLKDCEMIEQAAIEADPAGYQAILRNVTRGMRFEETGYYGARSTFYDARRRFFFFLRNRKFPDCGAVLR